MIKWVTVENADATRTLKQHGYVARKRGAFYEDKYDGNGALCNKRRGVYDGDKFVSFEKLETETLNLNSVCKSCLKISNK